MSRGTAELEVLEEIEFIDPDLAPLTASELLGPDPDTDWGRSDPDAFGAADRSWSRRTPCEPSTDRDGDGSDQSDAGSTSWRTLAAVGFVMLGALAVIMTSSPGALPREEVALPQTGPLNHSPTPAAPAADWAANAFRGATRIVMAEPIPSAEHLLYSLATNGFVVVDPATGLINRVPLEDPPVAIGAGHDGGVMMLTESGRVEVRDPEGKLIRHLGANADGFLPSSPGRAWVHYRATSRHWVELGSNGVTWQTLVLDQPDAEATSGMDLGTAADPTTIRPAETLGDPRFVVQTANGEPLVEIDVEGQTERVRLLGRFGDQLIGQRCGVAPDQPAQNCWIGLVSADRSWRRVFIGSDVDAVVLRPNGGSIAYGVSTVMLRATRIVTWQGRSAETPDAGQSEVVDIAPSTVYFSGDGTAYGLGDETLSMVDLATGEVIEVEVDIAWGPEPVDGQSVANQGADQPTWVVVDRGD